MGIGLRTSFNFIATLNPNCPMVDASLFFLRGEGTSMTTQS
jgi:hypothetical protein